MSHIQVYASERSRRHVEALSNTLSRKFNRTAQLSTVTCLAEAKPKSESFAIYLAHLLVNDFVFELGNKPFTAKQFLKMLRKQCHSQQRQFVFVSCLWHMEVWTMLSKLMGHNPNPVPMLVCAKMRKNEPLFARDVLLWMSKLDWSNPMLGIGPIHNAGLADHINMRWKWVLV